MSATKDKYIPGKTFQFKNDDKNICKYHDVSNGDYCIFISCHNDGIHEICKFYNLNEKLIFKIYYEDNAETGSLDGYSFIEV